MWAKINACNEQVIHFLLEMLALESEPHQWLLQILEMLPIMPEMESNRELKEGQEPRGMPSTNGAIKAYTLFRVVMDAAQSLGTLASATAAAIPEDEDVKSFAKLCCKLKHGE